MLLVVMLVSNQIVENGKIDYAGQKIISGC